MEGNQSSTELRSANTYREYLAAVVELERQNGKGASLRTVADRLGIGLSTFKMVLDGSRNLTIKNIHMIATGLNLVRQEREFFESLVLRDQAEDDEVRSYYEQKLQQIRIENRGKRLRIASSAVMQEWYAPAFLIYLLDVEKISARDPGEQCFERASKVFGVSIKILRELFDGMRAAGIIVESTDGKYHIVFERVNGSLVKQRYLKDVFSQCMRRVGSEFENPHAMFTAHTVSMPNAVVSSFFDEYKALVERYMSCDSSGHDLEILQICTQAVPLLSNSSTTKATAS